MRHTNNGHDDAHRAVDVGLWIVAGVMAVIALGDALILLAVVLAIVLTAGWLYHAVERRAERHEVETTPASVTQLRPAWTGQRDVRTATAPAS